MVDLLYKLNKTKQDIEDLLSLHRRLVYRVLSDMRLLQNQDAESAAWQGLWDAISTFDIFSENIFSTYAYRVMKNAILDELRRQQKHACLVSTECIIDTGFHMDFEEAANIAALHRLFDKYVTTKQGLNKNILLVWYSSNFEGSTVNIATICDCSTSYVSRVQNGFRAFISRELREG